MSGGQREDLAQTFDAVADDYDAARPPYPEALFEKLLAAADLKPGAAILEIGSGTGIATEALARRGRAVTCVEPGAELVARARRRLGGSRSIDFRLCRFEDFVSPPGRFDLIFAAQSFHWLEPALRLQKCAALLRPAGTLALFGNARLRGEAAVDRELSRVEARHAPQTSDFHPAFATYASPDSPLLAEIRASGDFDEPRHDLFRHRESLSARCFGRLLLSYSHVQRLEPLARERLVEQSVDVVRRHGGVISIEYRTGLIATRRTSSTGHRTDCETPVAERSPRTDRS